MSDSKKSLWHLRKAALFASLPASELAALAERSVLRELARKDVFYLPGDASASVFFVHTGRVKISKVTRDGKSLTLAYYGPADLFGEIALADSAPRSEMAEAIEQTTASEILRRDIEGLCMSYPAIAIAIAKLAISRRHELEVKLESLLFRDVGAKLAELLLQLSRDHGVDDSRGTLVSLKITHQEMANLIGATRETVSLTLAQFKRKQLIDTDGRRMILPDLGALRALL